MPVILYFESLDVAMGMMLRSRASGMEMSWMSGARTRTTRPYLPFSRAAPCRAGGDALPLLPGILGFSKTSRHSRFSSRVGLGLKEGFWLLALVWTTGTVGHAQAHRYFWRQL